MAELLKTPPTTERSWDNYKILRQNALTPVKHGVLPNIAVALDNNDELDRALASDDGTYFDPGDRELIAEYHPLAIALVEPAITAMRQHMAALEALAQQVDQAFIDAGRDVLFGVRMPQEPTP